MILPEVIVCGCFERVPKVSVVIWRQDRAVLCCASGEEKVNDSELPCSGTFAFEAVKNKKCHKSFELVTRSSSCLFRHSADNVAERQAFGRYVSTSRLEQRRSTLEESRKRVLA